MGPIRFKFEKATARLVFLDPGVYALSNVYSQQRGKGHARGVMQAVVDYADEKNFTLVLLVQRYGYSDNIALNNIQLISFYEKFDFVRDLSNTTRPVKMVRLPSRKIHGP